MPSYWGAIMIRRHAWPAWLRDCLWSGKNLFAPHPGHSCGLKELHPRWLEAKTDSGLPGNRVAESEPGPGSQGLGRCQAWQPWRMAWWRALTWRSPRLNSARTDYLVVVTTVSETVHSNSCSGALPTACHSPGGGARDVQAVMGLQRNLRLRDRNPHPTPTPMADPQGAT